uniref:Uncharacterized protein n=1 Tax=Rhizophora mucronata TaxID=61149 RepID=A0A2P2PSU8_RHIMU
MVARISILRMHNRLMRMKQRNRCGPL